MAKKYFIAPLISFVILILTLLLYSYGSLEKLEFYLYDAKAKLFRSDKVAPKEIKLILIDDASLKAMESVAGRWPWPRVIWSDLLEFLTMGGAKAVLFDILFSERTDDTNDRAFAEATAAAQSVYHSMIIKHETADDDRKYNAQLGLPLPGDFVDRFSVKKVSGFMPVKTGKENNDFLLPVESIRLASRSISVVEFPPDSDNVLRRTKPLREYQGKLFPVLGLAPFFDENTNVVIKKNSIHINDRVLPVDSAGNYLINMIRVDKVQPTPYSIGGILASLQKIKKGEVEDLIVSPEEFKDAIVFVGASAVGAYDLKSTPLASSTPGVTLHVSLAANYLLNDFLTPPDSRLTVLSVFMGSFLAPWSVFYSKRFFLRATLPILMLAAYVALSFMAFKSNIIVDSVPFIFATVSSSFLSYGYVTFTEAAEKRRVSHLFTQYVSKDVLNEVLHNYKEYQKTSAGTKVEITSTLFGYPGFYHYVGDHASREDR